jgi:hypothetical protein
MTMAIITSSTERPARLGEHARRRDGIAIMVELLDGRLTEHEGVLESPCRDSPSGRLNDSNPLRVAAAATVNGLEKDS